MINAFFGGGQLFSTISYHRRLKCGVLHYLFNPFIIHSFPDTHCNTELWGRYFRTQYCNGVHPGVNDEWFFNLMFICKGTKHFIAFAISYADHRRSIIDKQHGKQRWAGSGSGPLRVPDPHLFGQKIGSTSGPGLRADPQWDPSNRNFVENSRNFF